MSDTNERSVASDGSVAEDRDILARLRDWRSVHLARLHEVMSEAADEIERLRLTDARLKALEELSALDQALELEYGLTGNPLIKAQERTPPTPATPGEGSVRNGRASGRETVR